jgi:hypothetical protein
MEELADEDYANRIAEDILATGEHYLIIRHGVEIAWLMPITPPQPRS